MESPKYYLPFFEAYSVTLVTAISITTAFLGLSMNLVVLIIFLRVFGTRRFQSSLWVNLSVAALLQSLVMLYDALGNVVDILSDTETKCRLRFALPIVMNLVVIGSYLSLLLERMIVLHFPVFYSLTPKIDTLVILYGWCYGLAFLTMMAMRWQPYSSPTRCVTPYLDQSPAEAITFLTYVVSLICIIISVTSLLFLYPASMTKVDQLRVQMELKGTNLTVYLGTMLMIMWFPKQVVTALYWLNVIDIIAFQVTSRLTMIMLQIDVIVPFITLLTRAEFKASISYLLTFSSMEPIKRKLRSKENYIETINKLVTSERKTAQASGRLSRLHSMSIRSGVLPTITETTEKLTPMPRSEYKLTTEEMDI